MAKATLYRLVAFASILFATSTLGQQILPSNSSSINPPSSYPRFRVRPAAPDTFPNFTVAPLAQYAQISRANFVQVLLEGRLVQLSTANANDLMDGDFSLISCDSADYPGPLGAAQLLSNVADNPARSLIIFYSRTANHCEPSGWPDDNLPDTAYVFTTVDASAAAELAALTLDRASNSFAIMQPEPETYTNSSAPYWHNNGYTGGPATAKAMVILYAITGVITTLFIAIIITGAIRAHRHPERYGPRRGNHARGRQSRAKGIARAMLETIPIVKFGDQQKSEQQKDAEVELSAPSSEQKQMSATVESTSATDTVGESSTSSAPVASNADGSDESGSLGCSICTEDFRKGEEVRLLPCNHKFHPDCVDPWLLNVSGTCPLCRVDLRSSALGDTNSAADSAPPLASPGTANPSTVHNLRAVLSAPREERIAALRRFRSERRNRNSMMAPAAEDEQRGLTNRLTAMFRIRTRTHEGVSSGSGSGSGNDAVTEQQAGNSNATSTAPR